MKLNMKLFKAIFISLSLLFIPIESNAQSSAKSDQKIKYKKARALQSSTAKRMAKVYEALERIVSSCEKHQVTPGIHANSSLAAIRQKQGFRVLTVVEDDGAMNAGFQEVFNEVKS